MSKPIPTVLKYMTTTPHFIEEDEPLSRAHALLAEHRIRHLPVMSRGKLVGLLSARDLALIETLREVDVDLVTVASAMSQHVYVVAPDAPLDDVVAEMAERKLGSAIVIQNHKVVGILTTVDVCRALAELLRTRLAKA